MMLTMSDYRKRLYRSSKGQMVAGVCTGLGEYLNVDANLIRLGFAVLTIFGGLGILLYLIAWVILPEEGQDTSIAENMLKSKRKS
jgi:phage shock protein PspC (stress-responsive transcriptional regulator)